MISFPKGPGSKGKASTLSEVFTCKTFLISIIQLKKYDSCEVQTGILANLKFMIIGPFYLNIDWREVYQVYDISYAAVIYSISKSKQEHNVYTEMRPVVFVSIFIR